MIQIESGSIHDVVIVSDPSVSVPSLLSQYSDWNPIDCEHLYVSPGLIDVNVQSNGTWEGLALTTKTAVAGGVTCVIVEQSVYGQSEAESEMFCDVGRAVVVDEKSQEIADSADVFALKTYLFPPSSYIGSGQSILPNLLSLSTEKSLPLFIDPSTPPPRMLYMASPCRFMSLEERKKTTSFTQDAFFAAAFPDDLNPKSSSSSEPSPVRYSLEIPLFPTDCDQPQDVQDWHLQYPSKSVEFQEDSLEPLPDLNTRQSTEKLSRRRKSAQLKTIYEDLRSRIEDSEESIEELSKVEQMAYSLAGETSFAMKKKRSMSTGWETTAKIEEMQNALKTIEKTVAKKRPRPLTLSVSAQRENHDTSYLYYLANHPDHWEANGVEKVLSLVGDSPAKVHFCNLSSARSINKIANRPYKQKTITVETCPNYLFFTSNSIPDGETRLKSNPPIRNKLNCNLLWDSLKLGQIDVISSHHQPIPSLYKSTSFKQALPGIASIGFTLQAIWTKLCGPAATSHSSDSYIVRMARWLSGSPASLLGISQTRGAISKGRCADLVLWEPETVTVGCSYGADPEVNPYHGVKLRGKVRKVWVRGQVAFCDGEFWPVGERMKRE